MNNQFTTYKEELIQIYDYLETRYTRRKLSDSIKIKFNKEFLSELTEEQCKLIVISLYKRIFKKISKFNVYSSLLELVKKINSDLKNFDSYRGIEMPKTSKAIITGTEYRVRVIAESMTKDMYRSVWEYLNFFTSDIWNAAEINSEMVEINELRKIIENEIS